MEIKIIIGKEEIKFDDFPSEQRPRIVNDRILVPIYLIAQKIGLGYSWNGQNSICGNLILTVKKEEIREEIKIPVGKTYFDYIIHHTDGTSDYISYEHTDKIEPKIIGGRLMVPVRGVFRSMCYEVGWDAANRKVLLFPPSDNKYIVRYNYNFIYEDTDDTPYFHSALKGNSVTLPSPTREGYLFEGWFIGKVDGTKVGGGGGTYRPTDSVMLYAHWTDKYTIRYVTNGGEINATSDKVKIGESISLRTPTRTGFTFDGWYTNEDLTGSPVGSLYTPSSNVTLYAKWKEPTANEILDRFELSDYLANDPTKKRTMLSIGRLLANAGYHPVFIIGMMGHIQSEGNIGLFEEIHSTWYFDAMKSHNRVNGESYYKYYENNYSKQYIYNNKSLSDVKKLIEELLNLKYINTKGEELSLGFGLGCLQWTFERTLRLINRYLERNNGNDHISYDQVSAAEADMIMNELSGHYKSVYEYWQAQCQNAYSENSAYKAGYYVLIGYGLNPSYLTSGLPEKYKEWESIAEQRGNNAKLIYNCLI